MGRGGAPLRETPKGFPEWTTAGRATSSGTIRVRLSSGREREEPHGRENDRRLRCVQQAPRPRPSRSRLREATLRISARLYVTELVAGARRPRPGRPRKMAGETSVAVPKRRGRPRKAAGRKSTGHTRTATQKTTPDLRFARTLGQEMDALRLPSPTILRGTTRTSVVSPARGRPDARTGPGSRGAARGPGSGSSAAAMAPR